jgi:phage terminase small subunit
MPAKRSRPKKPAAPKKGSPATGLTPQQEAFVAEYLVDLNAKQAAIRAGYSPKTAETQGTRLFRNVQVKAAVERALEKRTQRVQITQDRVLEELGGLAFSNVDDYAVSSEGRLVPAEGRAPEVMRAVSSIKYRTRTEPGEPPTTVTEVEFRLWDKPGSVKLAGRHVGLFPNEVKVGLNEDTLAGILTAAHAINKRRAQQQSG